MEETKTGRSKLMKKKYCKEAKKETCVKSSKSVIVRNNGVYKMTKSETTPKMNIHWEITTEKAR